MNKNSLHYKILINNIITMSVFVTLIIGLLTFITCYYVKVQIIDESKLQLEQYKEICTNKINNSITQTINIAKSTYMAKMLSRTDLSNDEMIIFFDHTKDYFPSMEERGDYIKIYTVNDMIFETKNFSNTKNMPNYKSVINKFKKQNSNIIFDENIITNELNDKFLNLYSYMTLNTDTIIKCQIQMPSVEQGTIINIVRKNDYQSVSHDFLSENLVNGFICTTPINKNKIAKYYLIIILTALIIFSFFMFILIVLSNNITKKMYTEINSLIITLNEKDLLEKKIDTENPDELYESKVIKKTIQNLALKIKKYSDSLNRAELNYNELQLELLAKQLDPHMLYNSLSLIRLDAYKTKNSKIMNLVDSMSLYYREILKKDRKFITIREETETIKKYVHINSLSHEKDYALEFDISDDLKDINIPPQFLHTLVENSLTHGLCGIRKNCKIIIRATENNGWITIEIYDNGYGITPEKLKELNSSGNEGGNVGIQNSVKRLELAFGKDSTIKFESEKNNFTNAIIHFRYKNNKY